MSQLELFPETGKKGIIPSTAVLVPFPLARRRKLVMKTATLITSRKTPEGQHSTWRNTVNKLAAELRRHGADQPAVERELRAFFHAVDDELHERNSPQTGTPPSAA